MRFPLLLSLLLLCLTAAAAEAAGLRTFELPGGEGSPVLEGAIWTPCDRPPAAVRLRRIEVPAVPDCPTQGEDLPLVVISHGARGWYGGHHDTAAALADAGFVVTAVTHPEAAGRRWQRERPAAIERLIDYMLEEWPDRARLDPERIGFFGFSRGGYTGLVLLGGEPDFRRVLGHCREVPSDPLCAPSDARRDLGDEMADVLWVLAALANQTGVDLSEAFRRNLDKKTQRDADRHRNNPKLQ